MASTLADESSCFIYHGWKENGSTNFLYLVTLSVLASILLICLFSFIRKRAWDYGRIAFMKRYHGTERGSKSDKRELLYGGIITEAPKGTAARSTKPQHYPHEVIIDDRGWMRWLLTTWRLTDAEIKAKSGPDAVHYLSFQRHLMLIGAVIMVVSLAVVLPINIQGNPHAPPNSNITFFQMQTIRNLGKNGKLLWVHVLLTILYLVLTVTVLRHFSKSLEVVERDPVMSRTVMISRITKRNSESEDKLRRHFLEIYPDIEIEEISFAYDISRLKTVALQWNAATSARVYWEKYFQKKRKRPMLRAYTCGKILCCCSICGLKSTDAIDYYRKKEEEIDKDVELERKRALERPVGIAFVTFRTASMAHRVVTEYRLITSFLQQRPHSYFSRKLKANQWFVNYAPQPEDLYWQNLSMSYKAWYLKAFLVNLVLMLLVIVYSTPVFILNVLNRNFEIKENIGVVASALGLTRTNSAPSFLLMIMAVGLPSLVTLSDNIVGFWTKTAENRSVMVKTFTFLLFMVIILPSLGAESLFAYVSGAESGLKFNCIFSSSNAIFFFNYAISSSLIGTTAELLRAPQLLCYAVRLFFAKSTAERDSVRKSVLYEFQFGIQYTWTMLMFTLFVVFSPICPIITPFGFLYIVMKHFVDRYNIYYAYAPCNVDKEVHVTAINFAVVTMFLLQVVMMAFVISTPEDTNRLLDVFSILLFCITTAFFIGQIFFNMCTNFSVISHRKGESVDETEEVGPSIQLSESGTLRSKGTLDSIETVTLSADNEKRKSGQSEPLVLGRYFPTILRSDWKAKIVSRPSEFAKTGHVGNELAAGEKEKEISSSYKPSSSNSLVLSKKSKAVTLAPKNIQPKQSQLMQNVAKREDDLHERNLR